MAEFMNVITMSAVVVTLFLGAPTGPRRTCFILSWVIPVLWFLGKTFVFLFLYVWLRAALPRLRYDQLMDLGWKVLIPLSLGWVLVRGRGAGGAVVGGRGDRAPCWWAGRACSCVGSSEWWSPWPRPTTGTSPRRPRLVPGVAGGPTVPDGAVLRTDSATSLSFLGRLQGDARADDRPRVTRQYPLEKKPKPARYHGRHVLNRYEDGMEKCIGCELCAGVCPADCIYVRGADNPPGDPVSPGERYGFVYEINYLRCIHCDLCVEACPTEAITESKLFEFSFTNRADAIYTKNELLVGDDGRPQRLPWEDWRRGRRPAHLGLDAGHLAVGGRRLRGSGAVVGRARLRGAGPRGGPERPARRRRHRDQGAPRRLLRLHLDDWRRACGDASAVRERGAEAGCRPRSPCGRRSASGSRGRRNREPRADETPGSGDVIAPLLLLAAATVDDRSPSPSAPTIVIAGGHRGGGLAQPRARGPDAGA